MKSYLALFLAILAAISPVMAQSTWNAASGNWDDSGNWNGGTPSGSTVAFINNSGTALLPAGVSGFYSYLLLGGFGSVPGDGGAIDVSGGILSGDNATLGREAGTFGSANVTSGTWNTSSLTVGFSGSGSLTIAGGLVSGANAYISDSLGGHGSANVTAGAWNLSGELFIGSASTGSLNVSGGHVSSDSAYIAFSDDTNAGATVSNGTWSIARRLDVGYSGTGTLAVSGGLVSVSGTTYAGSNSPAHGTITLTGGTLSTNRVVRDFGSATLNLDGGVLQARANQNNFISGFAPNDVIIHNGGAVIDTQAFAVGISSALSGSGTFTKRGTGTLTLSGSNTYAGDTVVTAGRLAVNGSIAGDATVQSGATLGGSGVIGGEVTVLSGGTLAPGASPGQLTVLDNLTLEGGTFLVMEFSGTGGGMFDQIDVQGIFTAGGTLNLMLIDGFTPTVGATFAIFNGPTPSYDAGSFTITTNLGGGLEWDTSALASSGVVNVVPEPSAGVLVLVALGGILLRSRLRGM